MQTMLRKILKGLHHNDPLLWRLAIEKFLREDKRNPPPTGGVLFTGSSSIRFWSSLEEDMAPFPVLNRGFGGSMIHQVLHYVDDIVMPYQPRAIFLYAGENDIAGLWITRRHTAEEVCENFQTFCQCVHKQLPHTVIYYISIKPAKRRQKYWPQMQRANKLVNEICDSDERLCYIDIVPAMLNAAGQARPDLFTYDGVHMNKKGYALWTRVIRPFVAEMGTDNRVVTHGPA